MSLKSFFSPSRMCFDVLSIKRQRHRKHRELAAKSTVRGTGSSNRKRGWEEAGEVERRRGDR